MKILMVCLGNICRSPLAEGILKQKIRAKNLDWQVDSAGTSNFHKGNLPDSRSIEVASNHQVDILDQKSRVLTVEDLDQFDLILAMDASNYNNIIELCSFLRQKEKVKMIMNFVYPNQNRQVPDPYWDSNGFEKVYQMLDKACDVIIDQYGAKK